MTIIKISDAQVVQAMHKVCVPLQHTDPSASYYNFKGHPHPPSDIRVTCAITSCIFLNVGIKCKAKVQNSKEKPSIFLKKKFHSCT